MPERQKPPDRCLPSLTYQQHRISARSCTVSHGIVRPGMWPFWLTTQGHTQRPYIAAAVEGTQTNGVFTRYQGRKINGVSFVAAVSNPIIGKQRRPRRAIKTEVGFLDFASCVSHLKHSSSATPSRLRGHNYAQNRRRVIDVDWFTQALS